MTIMKAFLNATEFSQEVEGKAENCMSFVDFRNWCNLKPSARKFLGSLLKPPDAGDLFFLCLCSS